MKDIPPRDVSIEVIACSGLQLVDLPSERL